MSKRILLLMLALVLAAAMAVGCTPDEEADDVSDEVATESTENVDEDADEEATEEDAEEAEAADEAPAWVEPDPVPRGIATLVSASGMDPSEFSGQVEARADRGTHSWVCVLITPVTPGLESELFYMEIEVGDAEWSTIDYGTGVDAESLESLGVPADVADEIAAY